MNLNEKNLLEKNAALLEWRAEMEREKKEARATLERENPITCEHCHTAFEPDDLTRRLAYDMLERRHAFPSHLVCPTCIEAIHRQHQVAERERLAACEAERLKREAAEQERFAAREAERLTELRANLPRHMKTIGMPKELRTARLDDCPDVPPSLIHRVGEYCLAPTDFLVFLGTWGSGKSYVAAAVIAEMLASGQFRPDETKFMSAPNWMDTVRLDYGNPVYERTPFAVPVLVLDELGAGFLNDVRRAEVEHLIRSRHAEQLPTIITSNMEVSEIGQYFGGRVESVLRGSGNILKFPARDLRITGTLRTRASASGRKE